MPSDRILIDMIVEFPRLTLRQPVFALDKAACPLSPLITRADEGNCAHFLGRQNDGVGYGQRSDISQA